MKRGFHIDYRYSAGNFYIQLSGEFNGMCAWELIKIIRRRSSGSNRIFVNTVTVTRIQAEAVDLFKSNMTRKKMPRDWLYFKGKQGFKIAPNGSRVLICKKAQQPAQGRFQEPLKIATAIRRIK